MSKSVMGELQIKENESDKENKSDGFSDEFIWQDYMDVTQTEPVLPFLFSHVEKSLQSCFQEGMKIEVPHKDNAELHWVASIISVCGPLLRLRYVGVNEDPTNVYWFDPAKQKAHRLGWCKDNGKPLVPPRNVTNSSIADNLEEYLKDAQTLSEEITGEGYTPVERIKQGMKVEVQDEKNPYNLWIATVIENVGGRLLLRYDSPESNFPNFWLFYTSPRLFPIGFRMKQGSPWKFAKPSSASDNLNDSKWDSILESSIEEGHNFSIPPDLIEVQISKTKHSLEEGMKCEVLHPHNKIDFCPATITKVFDEFYFLVSVDGPGTSEKNNHQSDLFWLGYAKHPYIFPCGWAESHNLKLTVKTLNSDSDSFKWNEYLKETNSSEAPISCDYSSAESLGFACNLKLEAVNPDNANQICAATVLSINEHLLLIHLDSYDKFHSSLIISSNSLDIFPIGWCDTNSYMLKPPLDYKDVLKVLRLNYEEETKESSSSNSSTTGAGVSTTIVPKPVASLSASSWCSKIYFNHRCFTGPFLSKTGLAKLPKAVGPGPVTLVLKEVLSMLIGIAYIPSRVLKELQCMDKTAVTHVETLKAKYKSNLYRADVEIVTSADKVAMFCQDVCHRLQICPNLLSLSALDGSPCPNKCDKMSKTNISTTSVNPQFHRRSTDSQKLLIKSGKIKQNFACDSLNWNQKNVETRSHKKKTKTEKESPEVCEPPNKKTRYETRGVKLPSFAVRNKPRQKLEDEMQIVGAPSQNKLSLPLKRGRKPTKVSENQDKLVEPMNTIQTMKEIGNKENKVISNPYCWTVEDVFQYLVKTDDCHLLAPLLRQQEFDGIAFMLLNLPSCLESLNLNYKMAIRLCRHVETIKLTFLTKYKSTGVHNKFLE